MTRQSAVCAAAIAILRTIVVDKSNVGPYELPVEKRTCPAIDAAVAN